MKNITFVGSKELLVRLYQHWSSFSFGFSEVVRNPQKAARFPHRKHQLLLSSHRRSFSSNTWSTRTLKWRKRWRRQNGFVRNSTTPQWFCNSLSRLSGSTSTMIVSFLFLCVSGQRRRPTPIMEHIFYRRSPLLRLLRVSTLEVVSLDWFDWSGGLAPGQVIGKLASDALARLG